MPCSPGSEPLLSNPEAAGSLAVHVDEAVLLAQVDPELQVPCVKFQMEYAAAKASFRRDDPDAEREHLAAALCRMIDLSVAIGGTVLARAIAAAAASGRCSPESPDFSNHAPPASAAVADPGPAGASSSQRGGESVVPGSGVGAAPPPGSSPLLSGGPPGAAADALDASMPVRYSSVEDLTASAAGDAAWERGAALMQHCCRIAALSLLASDALRPALQQHAMDAGLLRMCRTALCAVPRPVELRCFAEGFRTEHMNALANLSYGCAAAAEAVGRDERLLRAVLGATRIDEENPGLVEWAEFTLRNVCALSADAREAIRSHRPLSKPTYMAPVGAAVGDSDGVGPTAPCPASP